jgi:hypothetical protein
MSTIATFSGKELRAIKRTFYTRKATPDEVCLVVRPRKRSWHMIVMPFLPGAVLPWLVWYPLGKHVLSPWSDRAIGAALLTEFWAASGFVALLTLLLFVLLPCAYLPLFEVTIRPADSVVRMRGFGFEQNRPVAFCSIANHHLWCTLSVDRVGYRVTRRWWQTPLLIRAGSAAIARALTPGRASRTALTTSGQGLNETMESDRRFAWVRCFGEAFVTENEAVLILPPPNWHIFPIVFAVPFLAVAAAIWHGFHGPTHTYYTADDKVVWSLCSIPMWLPSAIIMLYTGLLAIWADPWFRRAVAIIPKGLGRIRIQVGGRVLGETYFFDDSICVSDNRGSEYPDYLFVSTRYWRGSKSAWRVDECLKAERALKEWAGFGLKDESGG